MVNRGWSPGYLDDLLEIEFLSHFDQQVALDEARAEAERKAVEAASRR
ncbi:MULTISPECIES: hypothetical protein [unclassified Pseudovibrio]|nr:MULTISPECIES: hypothetical protein [unclassified Pseudovibrio]KZK97282.1 hypothetical protein PsW74_03722 [Pseudovibrio sp. W74]KZL08968.1 hypothetical protein PsAD14_02547 [Pseudovibrio sp. Ad14]